MITQMDHCAKNNPNIQSIIPRTIWLHKDLCCILTKYSGFPLCSITLWIKLGDGFLGLEAKRRRIQTSINNVAGLYTSHH